MTYHKHIDGLRAIAIAWVLAFHYFPSVFTGGFIGVDVFFVISGYLISGIIWLDLKEDRFSFGHFFGRRIRRLLPALLLVLTVTLVLGSALLHNQEFRQLAKHIFAASLYLNNWILSIEKGYFDIGSEYKPLLHLWSLSIEEQFYFLWPILIVLINRRASSELSKSRIIAGIFLVSFVACLVQTYTHPIGAFYSPHTRIWELLAGSALHLVMPAARQKMG
jgi:peptidoglycan/LPS O-acetylase OafA/YrhL